MFDVIVVGGGHAGVEACLASSKMGFKTALVTSNINNTASMPCNPSIGGPAKGVVVREIDALGGMMGKVADLTALQFKILNTNKGPGVWALRVQSDKIEYSKMMKEIILNTENLEVIEQLVSELVVEDKKIKGIKLDNGDFIESKTVILTTGTYMNSAVLVGANVTVSGPDNQPTSSGLSNNLRELGFELFRLKTGTPARLRRSTIDFSQTTVQPGDVDVHTFSNMTDKEKIIKEQFDCFLTYTTLETQDIINENLNRSSMYSGVVTGTGPRYCPSIEDKIVRFSDKERHQLFLEPESVHLDTIYLAGMSTSMPHDVQDKMIRSVPAIKDAEIVKYAYAIEYDAINPLQLKANLETMLVEGLFSAGQINGTSGYEEAACQGLMAGINACLKIQGKEPLILNRDEAYIGVLIDDLVTKGTKEPYRLLTSRAEYRLLLRHDNADTRLSEYGHQVGLLSDEQYSHFKKIEDEIVQIQDVLNSTYFTSKDEVNDYVISKDYEELSQKISAFDLLKRPRILLKELNDYLKLDVSLEAINKAEVEVKYEGYIVKAKKEAKKLQSMDKLSLPEAINYDDVQHLSLEARQKLKEVRPHSVGQASRISGVNPADIAVLAMYLENNKRR